MARSNIEGADISNCTFGEKFRYRTQSQVLGGAYVMDANSPTLVFLDTGGVARNVRLPPEVRGATYVIVNTSAGAFALTVQEDSGTTTILSVTQGGAGKFYCDGVKWYGTL